MTWEPELDELRRRTEMAKAMGGPEKVARQHEFGKLTVRERVDRLVDPGSFDEIGAVAGVGQYDEAGELIGFTPSNFVFGAAAVDGRTVIVSGDDFTVRGGSSDASIGAKRNHAEGLAAPSCGPHPASRRQWERRFRQDSQESDAHRSRRCGLGHRPRTCGRPVGVARTVGRGHRRACVATSHCSVIVKTRRR
jgi:hypothetical protein